MRSSSAIITRAPWPEAMRAARVPPEPAPMTKRSTSNSAHCSVLLNPERRLRRRSGLRMQPQRGDDQAGDPPALPGAMRDGGDGEGGGEQRQPRRELAARASAAGARAAASPARSSKAAPTSAGLDPGLHRRAMGMADGQHLAVLGRDLLRDRVLVQRRPSCAKPLPISGRARIASPKLSQMSTRSRDMRLGQPLMHVRRQRLVDQHARSRARAPWSRRSRARPRRA